MAIIDWQIMSNGLNKEMGNGIILYGASGSGEKMVMFLEELGLSDRIIAVSDLNKEKWNRDWMKYRVLSPYDLKNISNNAIIVITSVYLKEISEFLQNEVKCHQRICSIFSFKIAIHYDIMNKRFNYIEDNFVNNYKEKYNLWKNDFILLKDIRRQEYFSDMIKCITEVPVCILLCGIQKTGNMTLLESFDNSVIKNFIFTSHLSYFDKKSFVMLEKVLQNVNSHKIKIICEIRKPIERIISQKWQKIDIPYLYNDNCVPVLVNDKYEEFIYDLMISEDNKKTMFDCWNCFYADIADWFEDQIKKAFEIDIFDYSFDKNNGYSVIEKDNISIFLYRLDKLSFLEKEIANFAEAGSFKLIKANEASNKKYAFAYNQYLEQVKVSRNFFETLTNSKGMIHFYTKEECKEYREKWQDKLV